METPADQFIFMKKPSTGEQQPFRAIVGSLPTDGPGRLVRAARGWWTGVLYAGLTRT
jgi:hypothetical protein